MRHLEEEFGVKIDTKLSVYGQTDYGKEEIRINPKRGDVVNTIIHEKLHASYPDMPHEEVYANARAIESKMTLPEMAQELLEIDARSRQPVYKRQVHYTTASRVVSQIIR